MATDSFRAKIIEIWQPDRTFDDVGRTSSPILFLTTDARLILESDRRQHMGERISMRSDLQELEITLEQVKGISGLSDRDLQYYEATKSHRTIIIWFGSSFISLCQQRIELEDISEFLSWFKERRILKNILDRVYNYIKLIRAIDINDQLEAAGNPTLNLSDRQQVLEAIGATREDLIRALKTERILRDNKDFIASNPHMFATNLTALPTLQVSEQASEYGRLLDETLQIAVGVRQEIEKLQG